MNVFHTHSRLPDGGRVRIKTGNHNALNAIHDFLSFQIGDRQTADTGDIGVALIYVREG